MKRAFVSILLAATIFLPLSAFAQNSQMNKYMIGKVVEVFDASDSEGDRFQEVTVEILRGEEKGGLAYVNHGLKSTLLESEILHIGDKEMLMKTMSGPPPETAVPVYYVSDYYRIPSLLWTL